MEALDWGFDSHQEEPSNSSTEKVIHTWNAYRPDGGSDWEIYLDQQDSKSELGPHTSVSAADLQELARMVYHSPQAAESGNNGANASRWNSLAESLFGDEIDQADVVMISEAMASVVVAAKRLNAGGSYVACGYEHSGTTGTMMLLNLPDEGGPVYVDLYDFSRQVILEKTAT